MKRSRLPHLDAVRGIAALSVAAFHAAEAALPWYHQISLAIFNVGSLGTTTFFVLSGMLIAVSRERLTSREFAVRRFRRVWPLAILILVCLWIAGMRGAPVEAVPAALGVLLANLTLMPALFGVSLMLGVMWTLQTDVLWYLCVLPWRRPPTWMLIIVSIIPLFAPSILMVTLAICATGAVWQRGRVARWSVVLLAAIGSCMLGDSTGAILGRLAGLCMLPVLARPFPVPRWAVWLGTISYSLYLLHTLWYRFTPPILWPLIIPLSWASYRWIERPAMNLRSFPSYQRLQAQRDSCLPESK